MSKELQQKIYKTIVTYYKYIHPMGGPKGVGVEVSYVKATDADHARNDAIKQCFPNGPMDCRVIHVNVEEMENE